jgi:hypothetical protein
MTRHSNRALTEALKTATVACHPRRSAAAAGRPVGIPAVPAAAAHPVFVPPGPGPPSGDLGAYREFTVDPDEETEAEQPAPVPVAPRAVYSRGDRERAWARRRVDLKGIAGIDDLLSDVDIRADELTRRGATILAAAASS